MFVYVVSWQPTTVQECCSLGTCSGSVGAWPRLLALRQATVRCLQSDQLLSHRLLRAALVLLACTCMWVFACTVVVSLFSLVAVAAVGVVVVPRLPCSRSSQPCWAVTDQPFFTVIVVSR